MAQIYKTWQQNLEDLTTPTVHETNYNLSSPSGQTTTEQAPATPSTRQDPGAANVPLTPQPGQFQAPTSGKIELGGYTPQQPLGGDYSKLFAPVQKQVQTGYDTLGKAVQGFNESAGKFPGLFDDNTQNLVRRAVNSGDENAKTVVQGYLSQSYQAPALDQAALDSITKSMGGFQTQGRALDTVGGLRDLLRQQSPGLTPGEQRFEAQRTWQDPNYQGQADAVQKQMAQFYQDFLRAQGQAGAIGEQQKKNTADLAAATKGYLESQGKDIYGKWTDKVKKAQDENARIQAAVEKARKGDLSALEAIPASERAGGWTPEGFNTKEAQHLKEAKAKQAEVLAQFQDLQGIPNLEPGVNSKGRTVMRFPKDWFEQNKGKYSADQIKALKARALERDRALQQAGFSPLREAPQEWQTNGGFDGVQPYLERGQYADVLPMYFGEAYQEPGIGNFLSADLVNPTEANFAIPHDVERYNRIQDLLGAAPFQAGTPYQGPHVTGDAYGFQLAEYQAMRDQAAKIQAAIDAFKQAGGTEFQPYDTPWGQQHQRLVQPGETPPIDPALLAKVLGNDWGQWSGDY